MVNHFRFAHQADLNDLEVAIGLQSEDAAIKLVSRLQRILVNSH